MQKLFETTINNEPLQTFIHSGEVVWPATQIAAALHYSKPDRISTLIKTKWADDFVKGEHYFVIYSKEIKELEFDTLHWGVSKARRLMLLTEEGLHLVLLKTRKKEGIKLRQYLAKVILPQLRRGMIEPRPMEELEVARRKEIKALRAEHKKELRRLKSDYNEEVGRYKDEVLGLSRRAINDADKIRSLYEDREKMFRERLGYDEAAPAMQDQASAAGKGLAAAKKTKAVRAKHLKLVS